MGMKCGEARPHKHAQQTQAIVPHQALPANIIASAQQYRPPLLGSVPALTYEVELTGVYARRTDVFFAKYPRRILDVGIAQGVYPIVPGEFFQVTIQSLGSFGELS